MNKNKIASQAAKWLKYLEIAEKCAGPLIEEENTDITMTRFEKRMLTELRELLSDPDEELREALAAQAHEAWVDRQMDTSYTDLPESEKERSRKEADKIIAIFKQFS